MRRRIWWTLGAIRALAVLCLVTVAGVLVICVMALLDSPETKPSFKTTTVVLQAWLAWFLWRGARLMRRQTLPG